jgi:S-adenosylmethionine:tRNA ribosyltransferase-isomerase
MCASFRLCQPSSRQGIDPLDLSAFAFDLPESLIALRPAEPRESARLLVVHADGRLIDARVGDLPGWLRNGDRMVVNDTRVIAAALSGVRPARAEGGGGPVTVQVNLLERAGEAEWVVLARPGRRLRVGDRIDFAPQLWAEVSEKGEDARLRLTFPMGGEALDLVLDRIGAMPLPPYIASRRAADSRDRSDYQTGFATGPAASVAAPTAGLHLTADLLARITDKGVGLTRVRLDVGGGTFLPLTPGQIATGRLHRETCHLSAEAALALNATRATGGRIVVAGTTALRTLETSLKPNGQFGAFEGTTDIFLKPADRVRAPDLLLTNFHLPESSLFILVCAVMGTDLMQAAYAHAIREGYRFFSYGDACLLVPNG